LTLITTETALEYNETAFKEAEESLTQEVASTTEARMFILGVAERISKADPVIVQYVDPVEASGSVEYDVKKCVSNEMVTLRAFDTKLLEDTTTPVPTGILEPAINLHIKDESECQVEKPLDDPLTIDF